MFDRVQYNGYEIDVVPHKLADEPKLDNKYLHLET